MIEDDRLGFLGRSPSTRFVSARRLPSSLKPDRTGKDFLVEWPQVATRVLDSRPATRQCNVQVKATRLGSKRVSVKLSAAEWLVKDESPAFFVPPVFKPDEKVDHFVVFHIDGALRWRSLSGCRPNLSSLFNIKGSPRRF